MVTFFRPYNKSLNCGHCYWLTFSTGLGHTAVLLDVLLAGDNTLEGLRHLVGLQLTAQLKSIGKSQQSWALATTVATIWHCFMAAKLSPLSHYRILACYRSLNLWSQCKKRLWSAALEIRLANVSASSGNQACERECQHTICIGTDRLKITILYSEHIT